MILSSKFLLMSKKFKINLSIKIRTENIGSSRLESSREITIIFSYVSEVRDGR